jgi:hypothetical protein
MLDLRLEGLTLRVWLETICGEVEPQVQIGAEDYYVTADCLLMPTR